MASEQVRGVATGATTLTRPATGSSESPRNKKMKLKEAEEPVVLKASLDALVDDCFGEVRSSPVFCAPPIGYS